MAETNRPDAALWGKATDLALGNFPISGEPVHIEVIRALVGIKRAAALVNSRKVVPAVIDTEVGDAIVRAADQVLEGGHDSQFPVDVFQTGSGTSTNMNVNEVLATIASRSLGREVHPNDHVNASQSSNDTFPSAIRLATLTVGVKHLLPALEHLSSTLRVKATEYSGAVKAGRTHLMDATPVTFGQELNGYATQVEQASDGFASSLRGLMELPLGGTATGTGINAPTGFAQNVILELRDQYGFELEEASDHFALQGGQDALVACSASLRTVAVALMKCANDLRMMASGPATGFAEISLPALQPGSSIMPGKVNPVICEVVTQVAVQVFGNDTAVALAGSQGVFELNTYLPVMGRNLLSSAELIASSAQVFADRCVAGIWADTDRMARNAEASGALVTVLAPRIGYELATEVYEEARRSGRSIRDIVVERGYIPESDADEMLDVRRMAGDHLS